MPTGRAIRGLFSCAGRSISIRELEVSTTSLSPDITIVMNILITGSSGQIGTNLALALLARGDKVDGVDVRPNTWTKEIPTRLVDLTKTPPAQLAAGKKYDAVVHLAAHAK